MAGHADEIPPSLFSRILLHPFLMVSGGRDVVQLMRLFRLSVYYVLLNGSRDDPSKREKTRAILWREIHNRKNQERKRTNGPGGN
jgi:hypothetical protein